MMKPRMIQVQIKKANIQHILLCFPGLPEWTSGTTQKTDDTKGRSYTATGMFLHPDVQSVRYLPVN